MVFSKKETKKQIKTKNKNIKIININILLITLLVIQIPTIFAEDNSSTKTPLYLGIDGWCANLPTMLRIYNKTEYENRDEIENNLCEEKYKCDIHECALEENKDKDECENCDNCKYFTLIKNIKIIIHDGPFESSPTLYENTLPYGKLNYTFKEPKTYLAELIPPLDSKYEKTTATFDIENCKYVTENYEETENNNNKTTLKNKTYEINNYIKIIINGTNIEKEEITLNENPETLTNPENTHQKLQITTPKNKTYTKIKIIINKEYFKLKTEENLFNIKTYKLINNEWKKIEPKKTKTAIELTSTGIFAFAINKTKTETKNNKIDNENNAKKNTTINETEKEEQFSNNKQNNQEEQKTRIKGLPKPQKTTNSKNILKIVTILITLLIIGIAGIHITKHKKKQKETTEENKIRTYNEMLQIVSDYIEKYKQNFTKDQIYRALKRSNVPKNIIDEVFKEKF